MVEWFGVAFGGTLGAWSRFLLTNRINKRWTRSFPLATFVINVTGAFLLGYIYAATRPHNWIDAWLRSAVGIGFIGAYTTFSTFSYESILLWDRRALAAAVAYVAASVGAGLFAAHLGTLL